MRDVNFELLIITYQTRQDGLIARQKQSLDSKMLQVMQELGR